MLINQAYKFRIYPNKTQRTLIAKTFGCSRFVFNHFLAKWNDTYKETGKGLTYNACSAHLTALKKELIWLQEVDSISLQSSLKNLADSYARFFQETKQRATLQVQEEQSAILYNKTYEQKYRDCGQ